MKTSGDVVLKSLGLLLLIGAVVNGRVLLIEGAADSGFWSARLIGVLQIEAELALAVWLLSGLFRKAAWLVTVLGISVLSVVTLHKGLSGEVSCGWFGPVRVNPWVALFAIALPALTAAVIFRPKDERLLATLPSLGRFAGAVCFALLAMAATAMVLGVNKPAKTTKPYEVLECVKWEGMQLPLLEYIDIGDKLGRDKWIVVFYHHDCSVCREEIRAYEDSAKSLVGIPNVPRIAFVEMPPYAGAGQGLVAPESAYAVGKLSDARNWFVPIPQIITIEDGRVVNVRRGDSAEKSLLLSERPLVATSPAELDFGKIAADGSAERKVTVENISDKPVFLSSRTGCGCTKAVLKSDSLLPHHNTELQIGFEPRGKKKISPGKATERIALTASNETHKCITVITIQAEIMVPNKGAENSKSAVSSHGRIDSRMPEAVAAHNRDPQQ